MSIRISRSSNEKIGKTEGGMNEQRREKNYQGNNKRIGEIKKERVIRDKHEN